MKTEGNNKEFSSMFPAEGTGGTAGFSVPENYFEKLESNIQEKVSRIPVLYTIKSENPFAVPAQYFPGLEHSVGEKISLSTEHFGARPFYLRPRFVRVFASLFIIAVCGVVFTVFNRHDRPVSENDITLTDIYLSPYLTDLDERSLAEVAVESSSQNLNLQQFENYIIDNNTDIYTLTEEL